MRRSIIGVCLLSILLVSYISHALLSSTTISKQFLRTQVISNSLNSASTTISKADNFLTSLVPIAYSFSKKGSEKIKAVDNSVNVTGKLYENFEDSNYTLRDGQTSPDGKWKARYTGYGTAGVEGSMGNRYFFEEEKPSISPNETRASLVTTTKAFSDFQMTVSMRTLEQLRRNSPPNPWETAWIYWHYTDNFHYYAVVLKTNGFQIEKKDNNIQDDSAEIYLVDKSHPKVKLGQWQTVTIRHQGSSTGTPHIQVWVDGVKAADFVDNKISNSNNMSSGYMGLYNEDAKVNFDNIIVHALQ